MAKIDSRDSAPPENILERLATRTTNDFGKRPDERVRILADLDEVSGLEARAVDAAPVHERPVRRAEVDDLEQQLAGDLETGVDVGGAVEVRVVDQPLPAHGGARLLEVNAHDGQERRFHLRGQRLEPTGIFARRRHVVDRTGPDHHEQARIPALQYRAHDLP